MYVQQRSRRSPGASGCDAAVATRPATEALSNEHRVSRKTSGEFDTVDAGESFTISGRTISEADVVYFAGVIGDFNHLDTNAERIADSGYGERSPTARWCFQSSLATVAGP